MSPAEEPLSAEDRARLIAAGRDAFNRGDFYEAHEHWEEVWDQIDDPDRRFIQGLIQIATGLHKITRDQPASARTLLDKALAKLADAPEVLDGLALAELKRDAAAARAALERGERPDPRAVILRLAR